MMLETLAVLSGALFAGGALYVSLVEQPARMRLEARAATEQFRVSYGRAAPWQAATAVICALSGVLVSVSGAPWTWAVGGLLVGLAVPFACTGFAARWEHRDWWSWCEPRWMAASPRSCPL